MRARARAAGTGERWAHGAFRDRGELTRLCCAPDGTPRTLPRAEGVTPEFRTLLPVGNLSAEEAAQFCARCLTVQFPRAPPCDGARWARVLEVRAAPVCC